MSNEQQPVFPPGPAAPAWQQALRELAKRCAEITAQYPERDAVLAQRIDQFHVELITRPGV